MTGGGSVVVSAARDVAGHLVPEIEVRPGRGCTVSTLAGTRGDLGRPRGDAGEPVLTVRRISCA